MAQVSEDTGPISDASTGETQIVLNRMSMVLIQKPKIFQKTLLYWNGKADGVDKDCTTYSSSVFNYIVIHLN